MMFCPNCGTQADSRFCPNCGTSLKTAEDSASPAKPALDLEPYFQKYYPSRMRAAKALRRDTGIDLRSCRELLDSYFKDNLARVPMPKNVDPVKDLKRRLNPEKFAREERMEALDRQGIAYCPKCASTSIAARKRGFSLGKGLAGSLISPGVGLAVGAVGSKKTECVCMKCGHIWKP